MHTDYTMLMSLVLDEAASPDEEHRLLEHLRTCTACANIWERWQGVDRRLAAAPLVIPAVDLTDKVMASIAVRERDGRARRLSSGLVIGLLAASLMGLAAVSVLIFWGIQNPQQASGTFFAVLKGVNAATWILLGLLRAIGYIGAPTLAAGVGLLATATCLLSMLWLWVVGRSRILMRKPVLAR
jgi:anti-sigma factor RsiW